MKVTGIFPWAGSQYWMMESSPHYLCGSCFLHLNTHDKEWSYCENCGGLIHKNCATTVTRRGPGPICELCVADVTEP